MLATFSLELMRKHASLPEAARSEPVSLALLEPAMRDCEGIH